MIRPWLKFYPSDWQADERLGMCSLAARGLWMELLALMHKADPYGHLLVNGKAPTDTQIAALARTPQEQIPSLLDELGTAGVFSRTRAGVIYSRRLTRDEKRRQDGSKAAEQGGKLPGSRRTQAIEKKQGKPPPPGVVGGVAGKPPSTPEARSQRLERNDDARERLISVLDASVREHYGGQLRPRHGHDLSIAEGWIERGVTPEFFATVVEAEMARRKKRGADAPQTLKYFLDIVDKAVAANGGRPPPPADPAVEAACAEFVAASRKWSDNGRQGPSPKPEDFGMEQTPDGLRMTVGRAA